MRSSIRWGIVLVLASLVPGDRQRSSADDTDKTEQLEKQRATTALELCKKASREYRLCLDDKKKTPLELTAEPVLRWSNPAAGSIHGGVFLWTNGGRPAAVASIFKWFEPHDHMAFEVHSLSEAPLVGILGQREVWKSSKPGVVFAAVPNAPEPAESAATRLAQMRTMFRDFTAEKTDRDGSQQELRPLTQPVTRYESKAASVVDGALFTFVEGTDPEVFLLLEARKDKANRTAWHYALARMNSVTFAVKHKDKEVWRTETLPWGTVFNNSSTYNILNLDHLSPNKK